MSDAKVEYERYRSCLRKVFYNSEQEANNVKTLNPMRSYFCRFCEGYHLTKRL